MDKQKQRARSVVLSEELWSDIVVAAAQDTISTGERVTTASLIREILTEAMADRRKQLDQDSVPF